MASSANGSTLPSLVVHLERERARALVRSAFPRRRWKIISTRSAEELEAVFRRALVDAALIDLGSPGEDTWKAAAFAAEFPSAPFFAITPPDIIAQKGAVMNLNVEQQKAVVNGEPVALNVAGTECVLVRRDIYLRMDPDYDWRSIYGNNA